MNSPDYQRMAEAEVSNIIAKRQPLPVELLADEHRRLAEALESSRPLPQGELEELLADLRAVKANQSI